MKRTRRIGHSGSLGLHASLLVRFRLHMTKGIATARAARTEPNLELRDVRALGLQNLFF